MSASIFISFASKDRKIAATICTALENRGFDCWISSRNVAPGQNYQESITRAIRSAKLMVLVFTANANNSDEIKKELALASRAKLVVIPARVEDIVPNEAFDYEFATRQWIDMFDNWEESLEILAEQIAQVVPQELKRKTETPDEEPKAPAAEKIQEVPQPEPEPEPAPPPPSPEPVNGETFTIPLTISLEESVRGAVRAIDLPSGKQVDLRIPVGVNDGQQLRLKGAGGAGLHGGASGDVIADVSVQSHPTITRDGNDLKINYSVPADKMMARSVIVNVFGVNHTVTWPRYAVSGAVAILKAHGIPAHGGNPAGDLYVHLIFPQTSQNTPAQEREAESTAPSGIFASERSNERRAYIVVGVLISLLLLGYCTLASNSGNNAGEQPISTAPSADQQTPAAGDMAQAPAPAAQPSAQNAAAPAANSADDIYTKGVLAYRLKKYPEALKLFREAAKMGDPRAQGSLGNMYAAGYGVGKNYEEALRWFKLAASSGNSLAQANIALAYLNGAGVPRDYAEAMRRLKSIADEAGASTKFDAGVLEAYWGIGNVYGFGLGIEEDDAQALQWLFKGNALEAAAASADRQMPPPYAGHAIDIIASVQQSIGAIYEYDGHGVSKNYSESLRWFTSAAKLGNAAAMDGLGDLYCNGWGVTQDYSEAMQWYKKAAALGDVNAETSIGLIYNEGWGVTQDYVAAMRWYRKAATQGEPRAQNNIGTLYSSGNGVARDDNEALKWFQKAAAQGQSDAQYNLGIFYAKGRGGVPVDAATARSWMEKAAANGYSDAQDWLKKNPGDTPAPAASPQQQ